MCGRLAARLVVVELQSQAVGAFSNPGLIMSATTTALVLIGWAARAVGAGIWVTLTRDA